MLTVSKFNQIPLPGIKHHEDFWKHLTLCTFTILHKYLLFGTCSCHPIFPCQLHHHLWLPLTFTESICYNLLNPSLFGGQAYIYGLFAIKNSWNVVKGMWMQNLYLIIMSKSKTEVAFTQIICSLSPFPQLFI